MSLPTLPDPKETFLERWWQWLVITFGVIFVIILATYNPHN